MSGPTEEQHGPVPTLDYDVPPTPKSTGARDVVAGVFGVIAGLLAVPSLFLGFAWLAYSLFFERRHVDRPEDFVKAGTSIGIGLACATASWRWIRAMSLRKTFIQDAPR